MIDPVASEVEHTLGETTRPQGICETPEGAYVLACNTSFNSVLLYEYDPYP